MHLFLTLAVIFVLSVASFAQTTGSLSGTVSDNTGAVVAGAKVLLINEASGDVRETQSNEVGRFTFAGVRPGTYSVKVEASKFKTWMRTGFVMAASDSREVNDIKLEVGSASETVTVEGAITQVDLVSNGERAAVLSTVDIEKMALVSRNVTELLKVLPGVSSVAQNNSNNQGFNLTDAAPTGSPIGNGLSANGAPYRGGQMLLMDGASIIDVGCNCTSVAVPNPEFTQEVKVQTSNFGADQPNGPVVFSVISKSGGNKYHGAAYFNARNNVLNARKWQDAHNNPTQPNPDAAWYYPGGTLGGPVPGTKGKVMAFGGFEYYWQKLPAQNALNAWVPTASMRNGDFSLSQADNAAACAGALSGPGDPNAYTIGNFCNNLLPYAGDATHPGSSGTVLPDGTIASSSILPASAINPNMVRLMNAYFPMPNVDVNASSQYNWYMPTTSQQNGWVWRTRVDYNISDSTKLFLSYQAGKSSGFSPSHIWWTPGNSVLYPGGGISQPQKTQTASANFLHVFSPTLTNEMILTWNKTDMPFVPNDINALYKSTIGWGTDPLYPAGSVFGNSLLAPSINSAGTRSFGDLSQPDIFSKSGQFTLLKAAPSFQNNTTKVFKNHTFKMGFFYAMAGNDQMSFSNPNGTFNFNSITLDDPLTVANEATQRNVINNNFYGSANPVANFLMGVATSYNEQDQQSVFDMAYRNYSFYGMDDWKVTKRLTVNAGLRFDHVGRWYERTGVGMAVWLPGLYQGDVNAGRQNPGMRWHGIDPGIPLSGNQSQTLLMSPRLGFSFDLFGTGKTVLRGGWGTYRWNDQYNDYSGALQTAQGVQTYNLPSGTIFINQISPSLYSGPSGTSGSGFANDPHDTAVPVTYAYNFTISQQLPWRSMIEVAYVGSNSSNLLMGGQSGSSGIGGNGLINVNKMALGALFNRVDPVTGIAGPANLEFTGTSGGWDYTHYFPLWEGYGQNQIIVGQHVGYSNYNGLQVSWMKRADRLTANLNYTYSKALGIVNNNVDAYTVHGNYGILNIDRPHVFNASYSYSFGKMYKGSAVLQHVINDWTVSGTTTLQSGANIQSLNNAPAIGVVLNGGYTTRTFYGTDMGQGNTNTAGIVLPIYTCDPTKGLSDQQYINPTCIGIPAFGQYGDRVAPYLSGPRFFNQDLALGKTFSISERQKVEFHLSAANFFNHGNWIPNLGNVRFGYSGSSWSQASIDANYGRSTLKDGQRIIMLGLKYVF